MASAQGSPLSGGRRNCTDCAMTWVACLACLAWQEDEEPSTLSADRIRPHQRPIEIDTLEITRFSMIAESICVLYWLEILRLNSKDHLSLSLSSNRCIPQPSIEKQWEWLNARAIIRLITCNTAISISCRLQTYIDRQFQLFSFSNSLLSDAW